MACPRATDQAATAVFEAASKLHEAIELLRGLHDDEAKASGRAEGHLRDNLNLVIRAAGSSLVAAHDISALAETRLAEVGELAAAKVASNRTDDLVALCRRLPRVDPANSHRQPDMDAACRVVPILVTQDTIRDSVRQHWYDESSPSVALELRVRVEPPFSQLWRSVAAYFDTIRDAIDAECDSVERNMGTNAGQDTEQRPTVTQIDPGPYAQSRPASDDTDPRDLGSEGRQGPATQTPVNPAATPPPTPANIPDSPTPHERYPQATSHGALPFTLPPLTPVQQSTNPRLGYSYRNASLPIRAAQQSAAAATTPPRTGFGAEVPSTMATPNPRPRQLYSPAFTDANASVASRAEGTNRPQHQYQGAVTGTRSYGVLDNRPALFPPSRPSQTDEGQSGQHRDQTTSSQQASGRRSKESRYQELRQGIMAKHDNAGR